MTRNEFENALIEAFETLHEEKLSEIKTELVAARAEISKLRSSSIDTLCASCWKAHDDKFYRDAKFLKNGVLCVGDICLQCHKEAVTKDVDYVPVETQQTITTWANETFGIPETNLSIALRAKKELDELIEKLKADDNHPGTVEEIADVYIVLTRLVEYSMASWGEEVDKKMAINRTRKWAIDGSGHGQHVD